MMKKAAGLALALMMALPLSAGAADFANRLGASYSDVSVRGTVLKGGRLVDFGREVWGHGMTVEVQHGQGEETWYLHIQDLSRERGKNFFHDVTLARKEKKWNISPLPENPDTTFPASYTGMDLWYPLPKDLVDAMSAFPKDWKLTARKEDGKNFGHDFKNLAGKVSLMDKEPGALPNYGPAYSVYFPGEGPEEVQQAFLYHLNDRDEKEIPFPTTATTATTSGKSPMRRNSSTTTTAAPTTATCPSIRKTEAPGWTWISGRTMCIGTATASAATTTPAPSSPA